VNRIIKAAAIAAIAAIGVIGTTTAASAAVTVNPDGSGFVGKGDVQSVLGYNNKKMQESIEAKGFDWTQVKEWQYVWDWTTTDGVPHHVYLSATDSRVMAAAEARNNSNGKDGSLTGWNLTGAGDWTGMTPYSFHGDDVNGDGFVDWAGDVRPSWPGGNPVATYTFTNSVNGKALPGVTLPSGEVPPSGITSVG